MQADYYTGQSMNQSYILTQEIIENYRIICRKESGNIENWLILGRCLVDVQRYDEAQEALTKIFEEGRFFSFKNGIPRLRLSSLFRWRKNRMFFAKAYADLAMVSLNEGNLAESERLLTMALSVFEKEGEDFEYARAANRLGMVYRLAGAFESAEEAHYRAKNLAQKHQWSSVLAETLGNLGMVYEGKDRFDLALEQHNDALKLLEGDEKHAFEAACLHRQIGLCHLRKGEVDGALDDFALCFRLFGEQNDAVMQSRVLNDMTLAYRTKGEDKAALDTAEKAVLKAEESKDGFEVAANKLLYGGLLVQQNSTEEKAEKLLSEALAFFKEKDKKAENANASAALGLLYLRRGEWDKAESRFKDSMHIEERLHRTLGLASDFSNLGLIARKKGQKQRAAEYWYRAALLYEKGGDGESAGYFKQQASLMWEAAGVPVHPE